MVKKKVTHQSNDPKQRNPSQEIHDPAKDSTFTKASNPLSRQSSMEDPKEKIQNLKSLNSLLVKEAFESRQQIDSLVQAKEALEVELIERKKLEAEESEKNVSVELQNGLVSVYMVNQMKELGVERETVIGALKNKVSGLIGSLEEERKMLSLVCEERDLVRNDFELQVNEGKLMKEKLTEMEGNERKFVEEIGKLKVEYDRLVWEKEELEKVKSSMVKDRNLLEKNMTDMAGEVEHLRRENEKVVREKKEIEIEKNEQRVKIDEMEKEMSEVILSFRKEDGVLRSKIFELEKNCGEAMDREAERAIEIGALVEEKRAKERSIERLMEEKDFMSRSLEAIMVESEDRQRRIEKLLEESDANRRALEMNEKELRDMHKKIKELLGDKTEIEKTKSMLRNIVHRLQEECLDHQKKKDELVSEVSRFKALVDQITLERDNALKGFDKEKHNGVNLRSKVSEMENMLKKTEEELARKRTEWQNLIEEKKEMGSHIGSLAEDKDRLYLELLETKRSFNDLRAKMESTTINYERALTLLKNTASLLCQSKDEKSPEEAAIAEQKLEDEIELYAMELEAIKKAFKNKETVAQDLKQKKKSFWTLVSSATTLLAAITVAYAARGR
ncbi:hypothetical protein ES319_A08G225300v1 [Gossypium barbadense]|uniref:Uncharacterized protein n=1 Tax=Gossypium barbadense TaxID=3634 RepID=A0A5J5UVN9_GOSBA|nr:hypothetical protein ES319_A08G225300v1 [Gossypium barbadense]